MEIETLSPNEALLQMLVERDDVDGTNAVQLMRNAQAALLENTTGGPWILGVPASVEVIDDLVIRATRNGKRDIFA